MSESQCMIVAEQTDNGLAGDVIITSCTLHIPGQSRQSPLNSRGTKAYVRRTDDKQTHNPVQFSIIVLIL